jgi:cell division protein FtsW
VKKGGVVTALKHQGRVGTWMRRIQDFAYAKGDESPYQVQQAKIAIAKGGWFGLGPGIVNNEIFFRILTVILYMQ